jgi:hypothetical protein
MDARRRALRCSARMTKYDQIETVRVMPPDAPPATLRSVVARQLAGRRVAPDPTRFEELGEIGRGGMGAVHELRDR